MGLLALLLAGAAAGADSAWLFEEGTGTTAYDSITGNNMTLSGATWTGGHNGGWATSYNGTSNFASAPVDLSGTSVITVAFWMRWNAFANNDRLALEYSSNFNNSIAFLIDPNGSSGTFEAIVHGDVGYNGVRFTWPSAGVWHHYAFVLDFSQASNEVVPYVDGVAVSYTHQWTANNTTSWISQADNVLYAMSRAGTSCFGAGALDDVHIYKRGLSSTQIAALAAGADSAAWLFEEGAGTTAHDSIRTNDMTLSDATWSGGHNGGWASSYDGIDDSASVAIDLSSTSVVTVAFWMRWNAYANNDALAMEYTTNYNSPQTGGFMINPNSTYSGGGQFEVGLYGDVGLNNALFTRPSAGVWHHYAFVLDKGAAVNEVVPYVDGVAVSYSKIVSSNNTNNFANSTLYLMSRAGSSLYGAGAMDDVKIYKRALTSAEIAALAVPDSFAARATLSGSVGLTSVSNGGATLETGEPVHPDAAGGKSVWWTWTAPMDGNLVLTTENSGFDTLLSVYTGTAVNALTLCAANDDELPGGTTTSRIEMAVTSGTAYQIRADGKSGASGTLQLRWAFGPSVGILRELFLGIGGTSVANLTGAAAYPNSPSSSVILSAFGNHVEGLHDAADSYGTRLRGWFYAPQTGNYVFQIATDDGGQLYLSTNSSSASAALICYQNSWNNYRDWTNNVTQTSANQSLTAGNWYYLEALQKEGVGGDNLSVAVTYPDGTAEKPIERVHVCPYATQTIVVDTSAVAVPESGTATFRVRLGRVPEASTTVAVARASGDSDLSVSAGSSLVFTSANWNTWQTVTLAAATDGDSTNGSAVIRCSSSGLANVDVTATEIDRDVNAVTITSPTVAHAYLPDLTEQLILEATATTASHATPTLAWTKQSGPGTVGFSAPTAATTTATFSQSGTYVLRLTANGSFYAEETVDVTPGGDFSSWTSADIGSPSPTGSTSIANGTVTMIGGGSDINGTADQFRFVSTSVTGDATVICAVTHEQYTDNWAKFGIMFRDGTAAGAINFFAGVSPDAYISTQWRTATNGSTSNGLLLSSIPVWLKVTRTGNDFAAYTSTDGSSWVYVSTTTVAGMPSTASVGLAVCSHNNGTGCTATATNVSVRPAGGATNYAPLVQAGADATVTSLDSIAALGFAVDDGLPAAPGIMTTTWSKVSGPGTVTFTTAASPVTTASFSAAGTYVLRLTADDGSVKVCDDVTYNATAASATPIAWYKLDETAGTTVVDSTGHGHNGTLSGGGSWSTSGAVNGAVGFGSTDNVTLDTSSALSPANVTVTFWVKRPVSWAARENVDFWGKSSPIWNSNGFYIANKGSTGEPVYICVDGAGGVSATGAIDTFFPLNTWVHVAVTFSSTGPTYAIYRNGVAQSVTPWTNPQTITPNSGTHYLGTPDGGFQSPEYLDDVRVYGSVLTQAQIAAIYATGLRTLYWNPVASSTDPAVAGNWSTDAAGTLPVSSISSSDSLSFNGTGAHADDNGTMAANQSCAGLDFTGYTGTFAFGTYTLSASGDVDLRGGAATPFTGTTGGLAMVGTGGQTLSPRSGKTLPNLTQNGSGGTTLSTNDLTAGNLTVTTGTLTANGRAITLSGAYAQGGGAFVGDSAAMTITGAWSLSGGTFTATSGTMQAATLNQTGGTFTAGTGTVALVSSSRQTLRISDALNTITFTGSESVDTGLFRWLKFDENTGTSTADAAGSNTGTLAGGTAWSASTPAGLAFTDAASLSFDGVDDQVTAASDPTGTTDTFTVALWAYPLATTNLPTEATTGYGAYTYGTQRFAIFPTHGNGSQAGTGISIGTNGIVISEHADSHAPAIATWGGTLTGWTHVAVVFVSDTPTIYVNGTAVHTGLQSTYTVFPSMGFANPAWGPAYKGNLDDVRWYNRALSAAEISELAGGCGSGRWVLANALDVNGDLQIVSGALDAGSYDMTVAGSWTNSGGIFVPHARTVTFDGTAGSKTITSRGSPFYNLTIAGSGGGWTLGDALTVSNALAISAGQLSVSGSNFAVKAGTLSQSGGTFVPGTGTVTLSSTANQSVSTISSLYNLNVGVGTATDSATSGLVLHYRLDDGSGTTAAEAFTGNGQYALALTGSPTWSTDVPIPYPGARSLCFTADGQYGKLVAAGSNRLDPYAYAVDDNFTLALWVKPTDTRNATTQASSGVTGVGGQRYVLFPAQGHGDNIDSTNQTTGTGISAGTNGISVFEHSDAFLSSVLVYNATISSTAWTHIAVVYTARVPALYVNGTLVATGVAASGFSHVRAEPILGDAASGYGPYRGYVDDVRFYGRSLTGTEVAQLAAGLNVDGRSAAMRYTLSTNLDCDGSLNLTNGELAASTRTINVGGNWTDVAGFVCGTSTVILDGGNQTIDGSTTFYHLTKSVTSAATLTFPVGGETQTVTGTLTLTGVSGNRLTLASQSPTTQWRLDPQGTRVCNFLVVGDGFNVSSAIINPRNSVNGGNNTRWFTGRGEGVAIGYPLLY